MTFLYPFSAPPDKEKNKWRELGYLDFLFDEVNGKRYNSSHTIELFVPRDRGDEGIPTEEGPDDPRHQNITQRGVRFIGKGMSMEEVVVMVKNSEYLG